MKTTNARSCFSVPIISFGCQKDGNPQAICFGPYASPIGKNLQLSQFYHLLLVSDSFRRIWHWEVDVAKNLGYVKEPQTSEHSSTKITRQVHHKFYDDLWISILIPMMTANTRTCVGPVKLSAWRFASPQIEDSWQWKCIALVTTCVKVDKL